MKWKQKGGGEETWRRKAGRKEKRGPEVPPQTRHKSKGAHTTSELCVFGSPGKGPKLPSHAGSESPS